MNDSHVTPKISFNILCYGENFRILVPLSESDPGKPFFPALGLKLRKRGQHKRIF